MLPFAIDRSVMVAWARQDGVGACERLLENFTDDVSTAAIGLYSVDDDRRRTLHALSSEAHVKGFPRRGDWDEYPAGVFWAYRHAGHFFQGIDLAIAGDVPRGSGLSSSAAVEVAVAGAFRDAFDLPVGDVDLARLCQRAENEYVGVQSGIMDQFASALSRRDYALLIDCRSLAYRHVPLRLREAGLAVVIADSGVRRELVSSAYNERRRECEAAVVELRERLRGPDIASLRDVSGAEIEAVDIGPGDVPMRRARHVIGEIARVACAVDALERDDFAEVGRLMQESHLSLRDDFDVSSRELDLLVGLATAQEYVAGARLTGAGFGGCTVNLVRADALDAFERDVMAPYCERTGLQAATYVTSPQDGLRVWRF